MKTLSMGALNGSTPRFQIQNQAMVKSLNAKKSKITSAKTMPRFLVIGYSGEGALKKVSLCN